MLQNSCSFFFFFGPAQKLAAFVPFSAASSATAASQDAKPVKYKRLNPSEDASHGSGFMDTKHSKPTPTPAPKGLPRPYADVQFDLLSENSISGDGFEAETRFVPSASLPPPAKKPRLVEKRVDSEPSLPGSLSASSPGDEILGMPLADATKRMERRFRVAEAADVQLAIQHFTSELAFDRCREQKCATFDWRKLQPASYAVRWFLVALWLPGSRRLAPWGFLKVDAPLRADLLAPEPLLREARKAALDNSASVESLERLWQRVLASPSGVLVDRKHCFLCSYKALPSVDTTSTA